MELTEIYRNNKYEIVKDFTPKISFEIFPPAGNDISNLFEHLRSLKRFNPVLISLAFETKGAINRFSPDDMKSIRDLEFNLLPQLTCVSTLKNEIEKYIIQIENLGIENILIKRGNIPHYIKPEELDFENTNKLIKYVKEKTTLSIGSEADIEGKDYNKNIKCLQQKIETGTNVAFTKVFFDNDKFFHFYEYARKSCIDIPIIPSILPLKNYTQFNDLISRNNVTIPEKLQEKINKYPDETKKIGTEFAINQCYDLIDYGVEGLHFYTSNHSDQISKILENVI